MPDAFANSTIPAEHLRAARRLEVLARHLEEVVLVTVERDASTWELSKLKELITGIKIAAIQHKKGEMP